MVEGEAALEDVSPWLLDDGAENVAGAMDAFRAAGAGWYPSLRSSLHWIEGVDYC